MRKRSGFTLIEAVAVLIVLGILTVIVMTRYTGQGTESAVDASILKDAIRQTQMRAMSDLPDANWNISVAGKQATIKKDATTVTSYDLSSYSGTFSIAFDEFGKPTSVPALPYSITMDAVTGFIP